MFKYYIISYINDGQYYIKYLKSEKSITFKLQIEHIFYLIFSRD